jgi:hypothetical protein
MLSLSLVTAGTALLVAMSLTMLPGTSNKVASADSRRSPLLDEEEELGPPRVNLRGYCQSLGWDKIRMGKPVSVNGWGCIKKRGPGWQGIDIGEVCRWQFGPRSEPRLGAGGDPYSWYCEEPRALPAVAAPPPAPERKQALATEPGSAEEACAEPNDDYQQACQVEPNTAVLGYISTPQDIDTYFLAVETPARLRAILGGLPGDYDIVVVSSDNAMTKASRTDGPVDELIEVQLAPGVYYLYVLSGRGEFSASSPYTLRVELT